MVVCYKVTEETERATWYPGICCQPLVQKSEDAEVNISVVRALVPTQGTPADSEGQSRLPLNVELRDPPNSEVWMGLDIVVIMKEKKDRKCVFCENFESRRSTVGT